MLPKIGDTIRLKSGRVGIVDRTFYDGRVPGMHVNLHTKDDVHWVGLDEVAEVATWNGETDVERAVWASLERHCIDMRDRERAGTGPFPTIEVLCDQLGAGFIMEAATQYWMEMLGPQSGGAFVVGPCLATVEAALVARKKRCSE